MSAITSPFTTTGQLALAKRPNDRHLVVNSYGTNTGFQFSFQGSVDGTNGWKDIAVIDMTTGQTVAGGTITPGTNTSGSWLVPCDGINVRMNVTNLSTGSVAVNIKASNDQPPVQSIVNTISVASTAQAITSSSANALAVGPGGTTNPSFNVDASTASAATGINVKSAAAAGGVAVSVISSGTDESVTYDAKGAGTMSFATSSTGVVKFGRNVQPSSSDGAALGTGTVMWSDLFLASGAVINFNNGDVTVTHSANTLAFAGASSGYTFDAAPLPATSDAAALGSATLMWSDLFLASGAVINFNNGDVTVTHSANTLAFAGASSGYTFDAVAKPSANDAAALGSTTVGWSDLFLATGGVINWANGEVTITETDANTLTIAGITAFSFGSGVTINVTGTRITQSYHTNITSTNAVTVDSSETVKRDIASYEDDALSAINGMDVITFRHNEQLDPSGRMKLGLRAESVRESLVLDQIGSGEEAYPGVNLYGLVALQTRAIQQLTAEIENLKRTR